MNSCEELISVPYLPLASADEESQPEELMIVRDHYQLDDSLHPRSTDPQHVSSFTA